MALKKILFFSSLFLLLTSVSCEKQAIEIGGDSFSCYIDGELFVPKAASFSFSTSPLSEKLVLLTHLNDHLVVIFCLDVLIYLQKTA